MMNIKQQLAKTAFLANFSSCKKHLRLDLTKASRLKPESLFLTKKLVMHILIVELMLLWPGMKE